MHCCSMVYGYTVYKIHFHEWRDFTKTYGIQETTLSLFHSHSKLVQTNSNFCEDHKTDTSEDQVRDSTACSEGNCQIQQSLRTSCSFKTQRELVIMWESVCFSPVTFSRAPLPSAHPTPHSHQKRMYTISMMKKTPPAASLAYVERVFRYLASLLYFLDRLDKLLAFESNAEETNMKKLKESWHFSGLAQGSSFSRRGVFSG